jgi:hypothetical protein
MATESNDEATVTDEADVTASLMRAAEIFGYTNALGDIARALSPDPMTLDQIVDGVWAMRRERDELRRRLDALEGSTDGE